MTNKKKQSGTLRQSGTLCQSGTPRQPGTPLDAEYTKKLATAKLGDGMFISSLNMLSQDLQVRHPKYIPTLGTNCTWPVVQPDPSFTYKAGALGLLSDDSRDAVLKLVLRVNHDMDNIFSQDILLACNAIHGHMRALEEERALSTERSKQPAPFADRKDVMLGQQYKAFVLAKMQYLESNDSSPNVWWLIMLHCGEMLQATLQYSVVDPVEDALSAFCVVANVNQRRQACMAALRLGQVLPHMAWHLWSVREWVERCNPPFGPVFTALADAQKVLKSTILHVTDKVRKLIPNAARWISNTSSAQSNAAESSAAQEKEPRSVDQERLRARREEEKRLQAQQLAEEQRRVREHVQLTICKRVAANAVANVLAAARRAQQAEQARVKKEAAAHAAKMQMVRLLNATVAPKVEAARAARAAQAAVEERAAAAERARPVARPRAPRAVPKLTANAAPAPRPRVSLPPMPAARPEVVPQAPPPPPPRMQLAAWVPEQLSQAQRPQPSAWAAKAPPSPAEPPPAAPEPAVEPESAKTEDQECPVCLEDLSASRDKTALACGHVYCTRCAHTISLCATCREPISLRLKLFF
jgi:hypothetical protein